MSWSGNAGLGGLFYFCRQSAFRMLSSVGRLRSSAAYRNCSRVLLLPCVRHGSSMCMLFHAAPNDPYIFD